MKNSSSNFWLGAVLLDLLLTIVTLSIANDLRVQSWVPFEPLTYHYVAPWIYLVVVAVWFVVFVTGNVYNTDGRPLFFDELKAVTVSVFASVLILAGTLYIFQRELSRGYFIIFAISNLLFLCGWRILHRWTVLSFNTDETKKFDMRRPVLIVGADEAGQSVARTLKENSPLDLNVLGFAEDSRHCDAAQNVVCSISDVRAWIRANKVEDVIITLPLNRYEEIAKIVTRLADLPVSVRVLPDYFDLAVHRAEAREFGGMTLVNLRAPAITNVERIFKRLFDVVVASSVVLLTLPLLILTTVLIKLESKGPVFFLQDRVGENGRIFKMVKLRSMLVETVNVVEQKGGHDFVHKVENDPRVTKIGSWIRRTSIDELPQLLNVIWGDMSLVGPRPELPWLVEQYEPEQRQRFAVPQGMTGWWQVNGRSSKPMHLNTDYDLYYVRNYSFWLDLLIIFRTPSVVLTGRGAF